MERIALVGAGSIGLITGALIAEQGYDIELFDSHEAHVDALNEAGARLTGNLDRVVPVTAKLPAQAEGHYDLVILLTKQLYTRQALAPFLPLLRSDSVVCTLQNGTPEDLVASIAGPERTIAGNVQFSAKWTAPGESELATEFAHTQAHAYDIGELDGRMTERLDEVARVLSAVGVCRTTDNIRGKKWAKLLVNAGLSGVSSAVGSNFGEILEHPATARALLRVVDEAIRVGRAHGVRVEGIADRSASELLLGEGMPEDEAIAFFSEFVSLSRHGEASMLQDLRRHVPTEVDMINGRVIEVATEHGIDVPFNSLVHSLISRAERTGRLPEFAVGEAEFAALLDHGASPS